MPTTIYTYTMPWGEVLRIQANLAEASAPIRMEGIEGEFVSTPYQTADARHFEREMVRLVIQHLGSEWYADPKSEAPDEEQLAAAVDAAFDNDPESSPTVAPASCTVRSYEDSSTLAGQPSPELVLESRKVDTGAVPAYLEDGVWHYCQPSMEEQQRRTLGRDIRTVYVEE